MKSAILLVSGTDTGVGKTFVGCRLLTALRERGLRVGALKPVETGFANPADSDAEALRQAAGGRQTLAQVLPYHFAQALAPHVAASKSGVEILRKRVVQCIIEASAEVDFLLVEGAGGLMVPFAKDWRFIDLAQELQQPVMLVVGSRLGAINHAVLSFEALHHRGIASPGYVLNDILASAETSGEFDSLAQETLLDTNRKAIAQQAAPYSISELCYMPHLDTRESGTKMGSGPQSDSKPGSARLNQQTTAGLLSAESATNQLAQALTKYFGLTH